MKKLIMSVAAVAVALIGFGSFAAPTTHANPTKIWVINTHVAKAVNGGVAPDFTTAAGRTAVAASLDAMQAASGGQISSDMAFAGDDFVLVQTDDSNPLSTVKLNGKGLVCAQTTATVSSILSVATSTPFTITTSAAHNLVVGDVIVISASTTTPSIDGTYTVATVPTATTLTITGSPTVTVTGTGTITPTVGGNGAFLCDNVAAQPPNATDKFAFWHVTGIGSFTGGTLTTTQDNISIDSTALTTVGAAHDVSLAASKATIQEGATGCAIAASQSAPTNGAGTVVYTDINGKALVGYLPTFATSSTSKMLVGNAAGTGGSSQQLTTIVQADGTTIGAVDSYCGVAASSATLSATTVANEIAGLTSPFTVTRTQAITITGVPAAIALTASPAAIACDGTATSSVTAKVTDSAGNDVADNTPVTFSVVALGTANPITTKTTGGSASSTITPLSGSAAGVTVVVTAGSVQASIRVDCILATPTTPAGPAPTATPPGGIIGPGTGTGGYLGQDGSAGFPTWTLIALALGSVALVAGGMVTRRAGK